MQAPPPPQDVAQKWAAFGIVVLVAGGATCAATTFKAHFGPPPPEPPPPPEYVAPKSAPPVLVDETPDVGAAPLEPPPAKRGTPQTSLAARPRWDARDGDAYAPQHSRAGLMFGAARPLRADLDRGFVICRAETWDDAHPYALDDLRVRVTLGATPPVANDGVGDANFAFASAPLVNLRRSDAIALELFERRDEGLVPIAKRTLRFAGGPVSFTANGSSAECRALSSDALEREIVSALGTADGLIKKASTRHLSAHAPGWGFPSEVAGAQTATSDAAALAGWDDYRVKKRVERIGAETARLRAEGPPIFDRLHAGAGTRVSLINARVTFARLDCRGATCAVVLRLTNTSESTWQWAGGGGPSGYVATAKSGAVELVPADREDPSILATPGTETELRLVPADSKIDLSKDPAIVGVCSSDGCLALRAR